MRFTLRISAAILLLYSSVLRAQPNKAVLLRTGMLNFERGLRQSAIDSFNTRDLHYNHKAVFALQFSSIPSAASTRMLSENGIELLDYVGGNTYTASVKGQLTLPVLQLAGGLGFSRLSPRNKLEQGLTRGVIPFHAVKIAGTVDVWAGMVRTFSIAEIEQFLAEKNINIVGKEWSRFGQLTLRLAPERLEELAGYPFIHYVQPISPDPEYFNQSSRRITKANVLNAAITSGGRGLNGEGVTIGVGDDATILTQVDFSDRVIDRTTFGGTHGIHVNGTAAGAGIVNELYRGFAPKARIVNDQQSGILYNTFMYYPDFNMIATNNSYGFAPGCEQNGLYEITSRTQDILSRDYPEVLHVFAAGNSGRVDCDLYPPGLNTIAMAWQAAKNVLTVGATTDSGFIAALSSRGPVRDGRLKPELVTMGQSVISNGASNNYVFNTGTSMAAPAATGGIALLAQRYHQLHNNNNPPAALIKAVLCNGADDKGNPGPDFTYGFGLMNLVRSVEMLEKQHYFSGSIAQGNNFTQTITVPANTAQLKVMLYWHDPAGSPLRREALVNDLDLELVTTSNTTRLPLVLDTLPENTGNVAVEGADHINNIEQVVLDNPASGNYVIRIKGTLIPEGPAQNYYVVYDIIPQSLNLTYPAGGEALVPGELTKLSWDAYGHAGNTFHLDYSIDNGNTWINIASGLNGERRQYTWQVPAVSTANAIVRVSGSASGMSSASHPFAILGQPVVSLSASQCEGSMLIQWTAVQDASDYEVMIKKGDAMQVAAVTAGTSWHFHSLSPDSVYWAGVRARINGSPGRRSIAISRRPNTGDCGNTLYDNDLKLDSILSPWTGRKFTSTELSSSQPVSVRIKNLDNVSSGGFNVSYSLNGGAWITELVNVSIAAGATYEHSFGTTVDLSALGTYSVRAVVKNLAPDLIVPNDTLSIIVRQLDNAPLTINLSTSFLDNLESLTSSAYRTNTRGLTGGDRYDFGRASVTGELTTFMNTGVAHSGNRSLIMGEYVRNLMFIKGLNNAIGTFNLSGKSAHTDDIRLDFRFLVNWPGGNNDVWIRGSDTQPWIKILDFNDHLSLPSDTKHKITNSLELADSLAAHGQEFTSSFQIRWQESGYLPKMSGYRMYSIDDIQLYEVENDMQLRSIDGPVALTCGLSAAAPVKISVYNSASIPLTNIPVKYSVNNGNWVTEIIPSLAANTMLHYEFAQKLDLSVPGPYTLKAVVDFPGDTHAANDSMTLELKNVPLITTYPHLQDFELDNGGWYTEGTNSSWEYGTPASPKINRAASGTKAWKTNLSGNYTENEMAYLYSPCYDIQGMTNPTLSFSLALDVENCALTTCDQVRVEYFYNDELPEILGIGPPLGSTNWYNMFASWEIRDYTRWHVATVPLPGISGRFRFRIVFNSNTMENREGIAIDDIHIYDNSKGIYDSATMLSPVTKQVSGNDWIDFGENGRLIASIHPGGQNLGATDVQAYIHAAAARHAGSQYYHNRSIVIKPTTQPTDSVRVRFYFTDAETDTLIYAAGCPLCTKPATAYDLGVSKYRHSARALENGQVSDNDLQGNWQFIPSSNVKKIPFDKGYYAEFKVKDFSEFWLSDGGMDNHSPLPANIFDFTAEKVPVNKVLLQWKTGNESGIVKYEVEMARGQGNSYEKKGEVSARHATTAQLYSFMDEEADKFGSRYYRLKIVKDDGSFSYSPVRIIVFDEAVLWTVYPNPSTGIFNLVSQFTAGQKWNARVLDTKGRTIKSYSTVATGFPQRLLIDLSAFSGGIYLLQLEAGSIKQSFKLFKER